MLNSLEDPLFVSRNVGEAKELLMNFAETSMKSSMTEHNEDSLWIIVLY